jgi:transaldolase
VLLLAEEQEKVLGGNDWCDELPARQVFSPLSSFRNLLLSAENCEATSGAPRSQTLNTQCCFHSDLMTAYVRKTLVASASTRTTSQLKKLLHADVRDVGDNRQLFLEVNDMLANKPKTKILVDGGDPAETLQVKRVIGFVDGQTTNPSLIAKNPEIRQRIESGHSLSAQEEKDEYRKIVQAISAIVGDAGVSIEVFADIGTTAEEMLAQGEEMFSWIPNAYIKYPCTREGLRAAEMSVPRQIRVNMTLCFSQDQAAAVYAATKGSKAPVYVSPFVGRLDDHGQNGMDVVRNIKKMYRNGDGHVHVLAASIRHTDHLLASFAAGVELTTVPAKVLLEWATKGFPMPDPDFSYKAVDASGKLLRAIPYKELDLKLPWQSFDIAHELTQTGIQKFVADYRSTLKRSA